jgi:hypothetical protein
MVDIEQMLTDFRPVLGRTAAMYAPPGSDREAQARQDVERIETAMRELPLGARRSMEVKHVNIMKRARAAHRHQAMLQGVTLTFVGFCVLAIAIGFAALGARSELAERWYLVLTGVLSLAFTGWVLWRWMRQDARARARLDATPLGFVTDLMGLRERELATLRALRSELEPER